MDNTVKQRVIGAVVLVALAVIFVPMLLEKSGDDLGPVGGNLPDQPEQIVNDRIEPLTLPEPPPETEPAQVVLDQPAAADATVAGTTEPAQCRRVGGCCADSADPRRCRRGRDGPAACRFRCRRRLPRLPL